MSMCWVALFLVLLMWIIWHNITFFLLLCKAPHGIAAPTINHHPIDLTPNKIKPEHSFKYVLATEVMSPKQKKKQIKLFPGLISPQHFPEVPLLAGHDVLHPLPALFVLWATLSLLIFQKCGLQYNLLYSTGNDKSFRVLSPHYAFRSETTPSCCLCPV